MLGNVLALLCAFSWSLSIILLKISGARVHPLLLNLFKNTIGLVLLYTSAVIFEGGVQWPARSDDLFRILLSGFLGIGLADGFVLRAMKNLKASHIAILECLFAPFVIILSMFMLDEYPTPLMLFGGAMIICALFCVPSSAEDDPESKAPAKGRWLGILLMSLGLLMIAFGIILVKPLFPRVPLFTMVTLRMVAGVVGSSLMIIPLPKKRLHLVEMLKAPQRGMLFLAAFFSAYLSVILWVAGYKYLQATVAALLNQTSTLFTVLFAVIFLKERLSYKKIAALSLSLAGVILITLGGCSA